ncbi:MAG TPA: branched-chain amino acid ABC transporter permease, partial [Nitriliruptorales bacterium]
MSQALIIGVFNGAIYGLLALGIVMIYRGTRVLSFAQPELGTVAAFTTWYFAAEQGWPWLAALAVALTVVALASLAFERLVIRRMAHAPRLAVTVATVGFMLLTLAVEAKVWGGSPRKLPHPIDGSHRVLGVFISNTQLIALVTLAVLGFGLTWFLRRSDFGLGVLAASQDEEAARLNGVPVARVSAFTWVVAGVLAGIATVLIAPTIGSVTFGMTSELFVPALAAALLGGLTSLAGAFVGGIVVGIGTELAQF